MRMTSAKTDAPARARPLARRVAVAVLRAPITGYRWFVSPFLPAVCRHVPSCSAYAEEAISRHGAWRGGWLAVSRLMRCHPWGSQGLDPVPGDWPPGHGLLTSWRYGRWTGRHIAERFHEE